MTRSEVTLAEAFQTVASERLDSFSRHRSAITAAAPADEVHAARKDIARLRATLRFFDGPFSRADQNWLDGEFSTMARSLGEVRDLDILLFELASRPPDHRAAPRRAAVLAARDLAALRAASTLGSARVTVVLDGLSTWLVRPTGFTTWARGKLPLRDEAPHRLYILAKRLPGKDERVDKFSPKDRHTLRKRLKTLRYSIEITHDFFPNLETPLAFEPLVDVLDILGELNDMEVNRRLWGALFNPLKLARDRPSLHGAAAGRKLDHLRRAWEELTATPG